MPSVAGRKLLQYQTQAGAARWSTPLLKALDGRANCNTATVAPHRQRVASPRAGVDIRAQVPKKGAGEASAGAHVGRVLSRDIVVVQSADVVPLSGRQHGQKRECKLLADSARSVRPVACVEPLCA